MLEMSFAGEDHRNAILVCGGDNFIILLEPPAGQSQRFPLKQRYRYCPGMGKTRQRPYGTLRLFACLSDCDETRLHAVIWPAPMPMILRPWQGQWRCFLYVWRQARQHGVGELLIGGFCFRGTVSIRLPADEVAFLNKYAPTMQRSQFASVDFVFIDCARFNKAHPVPQLFSVRIISIAPARTAAR